MLVVNSEYIRNTELIYYLSLILYNLDEWTWEANQLIGLNRYLNSDQSLSNESFQSAIKLKHFSPSRLILTALCLQDICVSDAAVGLEYGRSPRVWAGRAPYFWTPWSRCAASSSSRSAVFTLLGPSLGGKLARMIVYKNLSKCLDLTSLAVWSAPVPARPVVWTGILRKHPIWENPVTLPNLVSIFNTLNHSPIYCYNWSIHA